MRRTPKIRALAGVAATAALALAASACTGSSTNAATAKAQAAYPTTAPAVTINVYHGFTQDNEVKSLQKIIAQFHTLHPNITVNLTQIQTDNQMLNGIRGGGPKAPDVAISFTGDNVGQFCTTDEWIDLAPWLKVSAIDAQKTFTGPTLKYTAFRGEQCALPFENDAYGLYYNKDMFTAAGITDPPKTLTELQDDAVKLTQKNPDGSFKQIGFFPSFAYFEQPAVHWSQTFGINWQSSDNKSTLSQEPEVTNMLNWQKTLTQAILNAGGIKSTQKQLNSFMAAVDGPGEFTPQNPFEAKKVAMQMDGEWRVSNISEDEPSLNYGTAPFPVEDSRTSDYGGGYIAGTVIGIARSSQHPGAAWELVKYLTTDTNNLLDFANLIYNVPSTVDSLNSPQMASQPALHDPHFQTFLNISKNPNSVTSPSTPNGGNYQTDIATWLQTWEAGSVSNLPAALSKLDGQIDADTQAGSGTVTPNPSAGS